MLNAIAQRVIRCLTRDSGQTTVEFAFVVPFLCGLIVALVNLGFGVGDAIEATHLANEGARLAAVNATPPGGVSIQDYIQSRANTKDLKAATISICAPAGTSAIGDPVQVTVTTQFKVVPFIDKTFSIAGRSTMRLEQKPSYALSAC